MEKQSSYLVYYSRAVIGSVFDRFVSRGFSECSIECIPQEKRSKINWSRGSECYMKKLRSNMSGISND